MSSHRRHDIRIARQWHGAPIDDLEAATIELRWGSSRLSARIEAPFADDPAPPGEPGSTDGLWNYEVVELFLVAAGSRTHSPRYLEIELSPHGHHLILGFEGIRRRVAVHQPRSYSARIHGTRWRGELVIDNELVPAPPLCANAFRIHGGRGERHHLAAYPVPGDRPDFHRVELFPPLD